MEKHDFCGDWNINVWDNESNKKVQHFLSSMFQYAMIPAINKTNYVMRKTATAIDHIIANTVIGLDSTQVWNNEKLYFRSFSNHLWA